jgi:hypothetical protein
MGAGYGHSISREPRMTDNNKIDSGSSGSLTVVIAGLLALAAAGGMAFCLIYALWWLNKFWAPW